MAKRRLSRQQKRRIEANQQASSESRDHARGLVVSHQGGQVLVELDGGEIAECKIRSNLGVIVCGDLVSVEITEQHEHRVIAVFERDNLLQRIDGSGQVRPIAANISQLIVCLAYSPEPNLFLLDQYLLSAEQQAIEACILINKTDLDTGDRVDPFGIIRIYAPLGYRIVATSARTGAGMDDFSALLRGERSVISGVSGVGKSSLTAWLLPQENIKIANTSVASEEGRHTTRASRLYHLPGGGELIDTPGVRGFNPYIDNSARIGSGFREIRDLAAKCRFHNCLHRNEPGCAVISALNAGGISASRYGSYLKMLEQAAMT
jgi:ribosome biogenesis GTPase